VASATETLLVTGVRCERCVLRLGGVLRQLGGIEAANATLTGQVTVVYDDGLLDRAAIVAALDRGGFRELAPE
jgi:copper chaperone CopZ